MSIKQYENQIYAGVLGKILGVYLGRPVEGWSYQKIQDTFGEVSYYVHNKVGVPLIVADDDISVKGFNVRTTKDLQAILNVTIEIKTKEQLERVVTRLKNLRDVTEVERVSGLG